MLGSRKDEIQKYLEHLLGGRRFTRKFVLAPLLRYVVESALSGKPVSEFAIAMDVLGKPETFDGTNDASVRADMFKLRQALDEYYISEGKNDQLTIELKPGNYTPEFKFRDSTITPVRPPEKGFAIPYEPDPVPRRYVAIIELEFDKFTNLLALEPALRQASGDPNCRVVQVKLSSVFLEFQCSESAYEKLLALLKAGELEERVGFPVSDIIPQEVFASEYLAHRPNVAEHFIIPIIDLLTCSKTSIDVMAKIWHTTAEATVSTPVIDLLLKVSSDGTIWRRVAQYPFTINSLELIQPVSLVPFDGDASATRFLQIECRVHKPAGPGEAPTPLYYRMIEVPDEAKTPAILSIIRERPREKASDLNASQEKLG